MVDLPTTNITQLTWLRLLQVSSSYRRLARVSSNKYSIVFWTDELIDITISLGGCRYTKYVMFPTLSPELVIFFSLNIPGYLQYIIYNCKNIPMWCPSVAVVKLKDDLVLQCWDSEVIAERN